MAVPDSRIDLARINIEIKSIAPLISSNPDRKQAAGDPQSQFEASLWRLSSSQYGFPADRLFRCLESARRRPLVGVLVIQSGRLLELCGEPKLSSVYVDRNGVETLEHRAVFETWSIPGIRVLYNRHLISDSLLLTLFGEAGFGIGLGTCRPERGGMFGTFFVSRYFSPHQKTARRNSPSESFQFIEGGNTPLCPDEENITPTAA